MDRQIRGLLPAGVSYNGVLCMCFRARIMQVFSIDLQALISSACAWETHCSQIPDSKVIVSVCVTPNRW